DRMAVFLADRGGHVHPYLYIIWAPEYKYAWIQRRINPNRVHLATPSVGMRSPGVRSTCDGSTYANGGPGAEVRGGANARPVRSMRRCRGHCPREAAKCGTGWSRGLANPSRERPVRGDDRPNSARRLAQYR